MQRGNGICLDNCAKVLGSTSQSQGLELDGLVESMVDGFDEAEVQALVDQATKHPRFHEHVNHVLDMGAECWVFGLADGDAGEDLKCFLRWLLPSPPGPDEIKAIQDVEAAAKRQEAVCQLDAANPKDDKVDGFGTLCPQHLQLARLS